MQNIFLTNEPLRLNSFFRKKSAYRHKTFPFHIDLGNTDANIFKTNYLEVLWSFVAFECRFLGVSADAVGSVARIRPSRLGGVLGVPPRR